MIPPLLFIKLPKLPIDELQQKKKSTPHNKQNVHHSDVDVCCLPFSYPFCKMFTTEVSDLAPVSVYLWQ
jgi:hypothetical protein